MNANTFEQREWWVSNGFWYPPIAARVLVTDLDLLYRETGLVRVRTANQRVSLWWDVDNVEPESLRTIINYLDRLQDETYEITLNFMKVGWSEERFQDALAALDRIEQVQSYRGVELLPDTRVQRVPLSEISCSAGLLRMAYATTAEPDWFDRLLGGPLARFGLFFMRHNSVDPLTFGHVGQDSECARMLGETWRAQAIGRPSDCAFTDERFDHRISYSYEDSLETGEPILEHIVGLIDIGPHYIWRPYQRLLLPNGHRLACFARVTQEIVCPFLAH